MVRQEEQPFQSRATLLLDTRERAHRGEGPASSFERAVSAAASIGVALGRAGYAVSLVRHDDAPVLPPGVPMSEGLLLDVLADVDTAPGRDLDRAVERLRRGVDGVLVAVLGQLDRAAAERLSRLRLHSPGCVAVLLDLATWSLPAGASRAAGASAAHATSDLDDATAVLLAAGWRVLRVGATTPLAAVWPSAGGRGASGRTAATRPAPVPETVRPSQEVPA